MQYIKTTIGIISVDDPAKVLSQKQYDALSNNAQSNGTYYVDDDE